MISILVGILFFGITLTIIVFVHELGHLLVAKKYGVYCHEFSIGMGPKVKHFYTDKSGTKYVLRALPLGGYVMLAGEEDNDLDVDIPNEKKLNNKKPYQKILILLAGAIMNFILAIVLVTLVTFFVGTANMSKTQIAVIDDGAMVQAGVESGDEILSVNGNEVATYEDLLNNLSIVEPGAEVELTYLDKETKKTETIDVSSQVEEDGNYYYGFSPYYSKYDFIASIKNGLNFNVEIVKASIQSLQLLFSGGAQVNDLTGPVGIAAGSSKVVNYGIPTMIYFIAMLSSSIGFINLMPFPALDGGRIVFALYELILRRKAPEKFENFVNLCGILFLLGLTILVTFSDVQRLTFDDDYIYNITPNNFGESINVGDNITYDLEINALENNNLNENGKITIDFEVNGGIIDSISGDEINDDEYTIETTVSDVIDDGVSFEDINITTNDDSTGIFEIKVDISNNYGIFDIKRNSKSIVLYFK